MQIAIVNQLQRRKSYLKLIVELTVNSGALNTKNSGALFTEIYKLDTKNKHSSVTRTTLSSFVFCLKLKKGVKYGATPTFRLKKKKLFESIKVFYFLDAGSFLGDRL